MKTFKEQTNELIERINNNKNYGVLDNFLINKEKIKTLIQSGEYFVKKLNWKHDIEEVEKSLIELKETIK